jgi:hypothetical protein
MTYYVLNETEGANPAAHRFSNQNPHDEERGYSDPWKKNGRIPARSHQLNSSKCVTRCGLQTICSRSACSKTPRMQPPSPKNWEENRNGGDVEHYQTEKHKKH